ncbi:MAG TPA: uracil-DNA glycosylase [Nitrospinae bacterium]|nr:uracil-DNA glycosylase [Nitrospinota bacterium]
MTSRRETARTLLGHLNLIRSAGVRYIAMDCAGGAASSTSVKLNGQGELDGIFAGPGPSVAATHHSATPSATQRTSDEATTPVPRKKEVPAPALSLPLQEEFMAAAPGTAPNQDATPPLPFDPEEEMTLDALAGAVEGCVRCQLGHGRTNIVFGVGNPKADLLFVGEAPGRDEDAQGIPFVGRAGQMLTRMIENVIKIPRSEVYICNILKCRPPGNRNPEPGEIACCEPYLHKQIDILRPRIIVALGKFAAQWLLATQTPIGKLRGKFGRYRGIPTLATYHPAYLLRSPGQKRIVMDDLLRIKAILEGETEPPVEIYS